MIGALDVVTAGVQKCLAGPSGSAPITIYDGAAEAIMARRHVERGIRRDDLDDGPGSRIGSNYLDLAMVLDYWSDKCLNHHAEATSMLYAGLANARGSRWPKGWTRASPATPPPAAMPAIMCSRRGRRWCR